MTVETAVFICSICGEPSKDICVSCTKDTCANHRCERCKRCSDCCECEVPLSAGEAEQAQEAQPAAEAPPNPVEPASVAAAGEVTADPEPAPESAEANESFPPSGETTL